MIKGLISILLPFKNEEKYLEECIESILTQSISNWELLVIDDKSTDISADIVQRFEDKDKRIKYIINNGVGIIEALKTGYKISCGEIIHRMDADDIMPEHKLEKLSELLLSLGEGYVATGKVKYFGQDGVSQGYLVYEDWLNSLCEKDSHWENIYRECVIASPAWMMFRTDLDRIGAFNSDYYPEDYDLVFRIYEYGFKVRSTKEIIHYWREHPDRISRNHQNYDQESFFRLRVFYFLKLHYQQDKELVVIGAGKKGKIVSGIFEEKGIPHKWMQNQEDFDLFKLDFSSNYQLIILFSESDSQLKIQEYFCYQGLKENRDYFFFR